ncbi:MAG UNVERIFIED_CONTAM: hypothetical protein LVR18_03525 [Planctomycetaceae bacterium]|jgi:hypothetical protein
MSSAAAQQKQQEHKCFLIISPFCLSFYKLAEPYEPLLEHFLKEISKETKQKIAEYEQKGNILIPQEYEYPNVVVPLSQEEYEKHDSRESFIVKCI